MDNSANKKFEYTLQALQDNKEDLQRLRVEMAESDHKARIRYATDKGREEGKIEGRDERKLEIAKNCKSEGIPFETIAKATGLTLEKIKKL
ncbi:MAG: hypothetical protein FWH29_02670 [Methanobrevibacter sp.]|nr:hypothetical protein [Methanobrevibacter sp.]